MPAKGRSGRREVIRQSENIGAASPNVKFEDSLRILCRRGKPLGVETQDFASLLTLDKLSGIIARGELLAVEFKSDRRTMSLYGLMYDEITVVEGKK